MAKLLDRFAGMSVLIIDDNESNVDLLRSVIADEGLSGAYTETDSRRIFDRLVEVHPDLVLLDLHMPNVDGFEILERIKTVAGGEYLPVIVLTADITSDARDRALSLGAQDFLTKPFDITEVVLRTANLLQTRMLYESLRGEAEDRRLPALAEREATASRVEGVLQEQSISQVYQPVLT